MSRTKKPARKQGGKKRSLEDADGAENDRPSKRQTSKPAPLPKPTEVDETVAMMDPALLADHCAKIIRKYNPNSTSLELEEQYLPTKAFRDTTSFDGIHSAGRLAAFLEKFSENGKTDLIECDAEAAPHTLIIAPSGIRAADLYREMRVFNTEQSKVAKFIAKHMKLQENVEYMKKNKVGIVIGTPARVIDVIKAGAIRTSSVRRIVVDGSYRDEKKRNIFEMQELFQPLLALLNLEAFRTRYGARDRLGVLVF
ncbi:Protein cms1 [Rhinocladiella similis]